MIIRESHIDTNATTSTIRNQLGTLDTYLAKVNDDVGKMNQHTELLLEALRARGETTPDLLTNLFGAYKTEKDKEFLWYIKQKESDYEDGDLADLAPQRLISLAKYKFQLLTEKGVWNAPSGEEEKIIALQSELNALKNQGKSNAKQGKGNNQRKEKNEGKKAKRDEPCMLVPPKDGEKQPKMHDKKAWW